MTLDHGLKLIMSTYVKLLLIIGAEIINMETCLIKVPELRPINGWVLQLIHSGVMGLARPR